MSDMKYVRLFAGPDGESHFEDVVVEFTSNPASAIPRSEMSEWLLAERVRFQSFPPGWKREGRAPQREYLVYLAGAAAMQASDGEVRHFQKGDVELVDDTTGKGHTSWTNGDDTCLLMTIFLEGPEQL
jgi:hypothetical protein